MSDDTDLRAVLAVGLVFAVLVYGGLVGVESVVDGGGSEPTVTGELAVQGTTFHLDRAGRPTVVGEVHNGLADPATDLSVTVTFYRDGERVGAVTRGALRETVDTGETAPFDVHLPTEAEVDDYDVAVSYDRADAVSDPLAVTDHRVVHRGSDRVEVRGTVENAGDEPVASSRVVATFYAANGSVIGARTVRVGRTVAPGESATVRVQFRTLGDVPSLAREFDRAKLTAVADG